MTLTSGSPVTLATRRPDESPTDNTARCRPATATPATGDPAEAAVDGTAASSWLAERPGVRLQVDLGAAVPLGSLSLIRPDVLAIATGDTSIEDHAVTGPTRSAGSDVSVSADGRTWTRLAALPGGALREDVAGSGQPVRFVRVTAARGTSEKRPLVVGELVVRRG